MLMKVAQALACGAALAFAAPAFGQEGSYSRPKVDVTKNDAAVRDYQEATKLYQDGKFEQAKQKLKTFIEKHPEHAGGNLVMGLTQIQLQDFEQARIYFRQTVKIDGTQVAARGWLGALDAALGNAAGAAEQKAALDAMKAACAGTCPKAGDIDQAILRVVENQQAAAAPKPS
jgi:cytochrome c-type biogenesis protein CcmH/NrfG